VGNYGVAYNVLFAELYDANLVETAKAVDSIHKTVFTAEDF
jgi:hypothetical protein